MSELLESLEVSEKEALGRAATSEELIESISLLYSIAPKHKDMLLKMVRGDANMLISAIGLVKTIAALIDPQSAVSKPPLPITDKL